MRFPTLLATALAIPGALVAQGNAPGHVGQGGAAAVAQLSQRLPADVADQVLAIVTDATSHGLPGQSIANAALEGSARGRSGDQIVTAARNQAVRLAQSRSAVVDAGRTPTATDVEAGAQALASGVDGATISALARSAPSGRSLAVPLAVLGGLVNRGLPSDVALQAVSDRLAAQAADDDLSQMPGAAGRMIAAGHTPAEVGQTLGTGQGAPPTGSPVPPTSVPPTNPGVPSDRPTPSSHPTGRP